MNHTSLDSFLAHTVGITPGDWSLSHSTKALTVRCGDRRIAQIGSSSTNKETAREELANALLIANAPKLRRDVGILRLTLDELTAEIHRVHEELARPRWQIVRFFAPFYGVMRSALWLAGLPIVGIVGILCLAVSLVLIALQTVIWFTTGNDRLWDVVDWVCGVFDTMEHAWSKVLCR